MADPAAQVLDFLFTRMQIDEEWAVRKARGFTWWAGPHAQRVWASASREVDGVPVTTIHIETDLLKKVPAGSDTLARLAGVNRLATMSAYVADLDKRRVALHASVSITGDNLPLARGLALHAMAIQAADAHDEAEPLAEVFGAEPDVTGHPDKGEREDLDEMLGVLEIYEQRGEGKSPFKAEELAALVHLEPRPWLSIGNTLDGLEAELPFSDAGTSRLEFDTKERHPALGSGLHIRLVLPVDAAAASVQRLNNAEIIEPDAHQLGGWCLDDERGLMFASFIPAAAHAPNVAQALLYHMASRNAWAAHELG